MIYCSSRVSRKFAYITTDNSIRIIMFDRDYISISKLTIHHEIIECIVNMNFISEKEIIIMTNNSDIKILNIYNSTCKDFQSDVIPNTILNIKSCSMSYAFMNYLYDTKNIYSFTDVAKKIDLELDQNEIIRDIYVRYYTLVIFTDTKTIIYDTIFNLCKIINKKSTYVEIFYNCAFLLGIDGIVDIYDNNYNYQLSVLDKSVCNMSRVHNSVHLTVKIDNKFQYYYCSYVYHASDRSYQYILQKSFDETTYDSKNYCVNNSRYNFQIYNNTCITCITHNIHHGSSKQFTVDLQYEISHIIDLDCIVCIVNCENTIKYYSFSHNPNHCILLTIINDDDDKKIKNMMGLRTKKALK